MNEHEKLLTWYVRLFCHLQLGRMRRQTKQQLLIVAVVGIVVLLAYTQGGFGSSGVSLCACF